LTGPQRIIAASLAPLGRIEAKEEGRRFSRRTAFLRPAMSEHAGFCHEADRRHFVDGYLKAGLLL